jgi:hypothetical protein
MHSKVALLAALAALTLVVAGVALARPAGTQQRVAIASKGGNVDAFVLTPLGSGPLSRDSGTWSSCCWSRHFIRRDGQAIEIDDPAASFVGKRGTFAWRARIEWTDPGNGYSVGTGTWKITHGTGAYAHLAGRGRLAVISRGLDTGVTTRAEGLVSLGG